MDYFLLANGIHAKLNSNNLTINLNMKSMCLEMSKTNQSRVTYTAIIKPIQ